jgi:hypothetical protein
MFTNLKNSHLQLPVDGYFSHFTKNSDENWLVFSF